MNEILLNKAKNHFMRKEEKLFKCLKRVRKNKIFNNRLLFRKIVIEFIEDPMQGNMQGKISGLYEFFTWLDRKLEKEKETKPQE